MLSRQIGCEKRPSVTPGDPEFQKYAKSFVLLEDLREVEKEPEPCALVAPVKDLVPMGKSLWRRVRERLWWSLMAFLQNKYCRYLLIFLFLGVFLRQSFSKALGKLLVTSVRLTMRRCISFLVMMAEGIFDELIYQLDYVLRDALPAGNEFARSHSSNHELVVPYLVRCCGCSYSYVCYTPYAPAAMTAMHHRACGRLQLLRLFAAPPPLHSPMGGFGL